MWISSLLSPKKRPKFFYFSSLFQSSSKLYEYKLKICKKEKPSLQSIPLFLDKGGKGYITPDDILNFCCENGVDINYSEAYHILFSLDPGFEGRFQNEL